MDHEHCLGRVQNDQLHQVARPVGTGQQIAGRVVIEFDPRDGMLAGVKDVIIGNLVPSG